MFSLMEMQRPWVRFSWRTLAGFVILVGLAGNTMADQTETDASKPIAVRAGPIRMILQDGQLRYLRVGEKEVVRRIYFAVRDGGWATIPPRFTQMKVTQSDEAFSAEMAAECKQGPVQFHWTGRIEGTREGTITFHTEGFPEADFQSNRIGLCVLYGSPSLAGQEFQSFASTDEKGDAQVGTFPHLVSPDLVAKKFRLLQYKSPQGLTVDCSLTGSVFDMEDQRNWGDSSYKAYAPLDYAYPNVRKDQKTDQTVTLKVAGGTDPGKVVGPETVQIHIGGPIKDAKIPKLVTFDKSWSKATGFVDINHSRQKFESAKEVTWAYTSATHLPDDDTQMENPPALADQVATAKSFAPKAVCRVGPIHLESSSGPGGHDPRAAQPLAAAWAAEVVKYLSEAGVSEAAFDLGDGPWRCGPVRFCRALRSNLACRRDGADRRCGS